MNISYLEKETYIEQFKKYAIEAHRSTNHFYDGDWPYHLHLEGAVREAESFMHLLLKDLIVPTDRWQIECDVIRAVWGHDLIEDTRQSYRDVWAQSNNAVADIVRACTCYTGGKTREERMPDWIYELIRETQNADFVKLCDRLANVRWGIYTKSKMPKMYREENDKFISKVTKRPDVLAPMITELDTLFKQI